jgi:hypothetical protein
MNLETAREIFELHSNSTNLHPVGAQLLHAGGQTDRHDEANSRFSQFCESVYKCM